MAWPTAKRTIFIITFLYAFTWVGGWIYSRDVARATAAVYENAKRHTIQKIDDARVRGATEDELSFIQLRGHSEEGPWSRVFCVPLLPGILPADKGVEIGPLSGGGSRQIVFFYGWGSMELCELFVPYRV